MRFSSILTNLGKTSPDLLEILPNLRLKERERAMNNKMSEWGLVGPVKIDFSCVDLPIDSPILVHGGGDPSLPSPESGQTVFNPA